MSAVSARPPAVSTPVDERAEAFLLESDVTIEHLRGRSWTADLFRTIAAARGSVCYSPVTAAAIYHGVRPGEEEATARLFASLPCLSIDQAIGQQAGEYLRRYRASHGLTLGDALIAATAHVHDLVLLTRNRRHYPMPELRLATLPEPTA